LEFAAEHPKTSPQPNLAVRSAPHQGSGHSQAILRYHPPELLLGCCDHFAGHGHGLHVALDGDALAHPIHRLLDHARGHEFGHEFGHCFPGYDRFGKALPAARHHPTEQDEKTALAYRLTVWVVSMNAGALHRRHRAVLLQNHHLLVDVRLVGAAVPDEPLVAFSF
jgi:hypothetical protein